MPSTAPRLHIVYRSHGGDNTKGRPPFYSKLLGLSSLLRAVEWLERSGAPTPELLFVNDGPIPQDRLSLMHRHGEVIPVNGGSNRRSYRAAIALAAARPWPDTDVVWFAEDDYLYGVESLLQLTEAATRLPEADYLSMWGYLALDPTSPRTSPQTREEPRSLGDPQAYALDGLRWYRGASTTSTFGVRAAVLRQDAGLLRVLPFSGGAWDHTTCMTVQGRRPFTAEEVRAHLLPTAEPVTAWPRLITRGLVQVAVNLRSRRRPEHCRVLYMSDPETIFHMELPSLAAGRDWDEFARSAVRWALDHDIAVSADPARRSTAP